MLRICPGEEQLYLAAHRRAEQTEGAPRAAAQEEENQEYDYDWAQRPEDKHTRTRHGELFAENIQHKRIITLKVNNVTTTGLQHALMHDLVGMF